MTNFSENDHLRKYYLQHDQAPTQSMMKEKMSPNLAALLLNSMTPKLKVIAGIEPPLKGGGNDWFVSPKEALEESRVVLKPLKNEYLTKLNHFIIVERGPRTLRNHHIDLYEEKNKMLLESDNVWKENVAIASKKYYEECVALNKEHNTSYLNNAFDMFSSIYRTNFNIIEMIVHEESIRELNKTRNQTLSKMQNRYAVLLKSQAILISDEFTARLGREKARLKAQFIEQLDISRTNMTKNIHDLCVDKHVAIEKLRKYLECQNLACQIYVSLKERDACLKETETSEHKHKKNLKTLNDYIALQDVKIRFAEQKEQTQKVFDSLWLKKICHFVKNFQVFVLYCLETLPEHAEFFINMEKLMLLQVNEALENPTAESIIVAEQETLQTPVTLPNPFYLFCDRGCNPNVDQNLCLKRSSTSSASQLPVIIINKRCLYAACDNFRQLNDKINDFIHGTDADIEDDLIYENFVPVKYTSSQQLSELKLESSLLQLLQQEMRNIREVPVECGMCKLPHCFCTSHLTTEQSIGRNKREHIVEQQSQPTNANAATSISRLAHEREPKLGGYSKYIEPKKCTCGRRARKNLDDNLPVYMRNVSKYEAPRLPNYKMCSAATLKKLVEKARGTGKTTSQITNIPSSKKQYSVSTQYSDYEYDWCCTCQHTCKICSAIKEDVETDFYNVVGHARTADQLCLEADSPSFMTKQKNVFATDRAHSLRNLINDMPELIELFAKNKDC